MIKIEIINNKLENSLNLLIQNIFNQLNTQKLLEEMHLLDILSRLDDIINRIIESGFADDHDAEILALIPETDRLFQPRNGMDHIDSLMKWFRIL